MMIKKLKENLSRYSCMSAGDKAYMAAIGKSNFILLRDDGKWEGSCVGTCFTNHIIYRLKPDYVCTIIRVPDNIKLEVRGVRYGCQVLYYDCGIGWGICPHTDMPLRGAVLDPREWVDIPIGSVCYAAPDCKPHFDSQSLYCIKINEHSCVSIDSEGAYVHLSTYSYNWYIVEGGSNE